MHALYHHIPEFLKLYINVAHFNQQGMEKYTDIAAKDYFRSPNHRGIAALEKLFLKKLRVQFLEAAGCERVKKSTNAPTAKIMVILSRQVIVAPLIVKMCQFDPLHTNFEGAKVNSVETVCKEHISDFLTQNSDFGPITDKIKINGDGTRMTRNSNLLYFYFLCCKLGLVNGSESYHTLRVISEFVQGSNILNYHR